MNLRHDLTIFMIGNVYIGDEYNGRIRKITISTGIITTIAGTGTTSTSIGDGGPATSATLYNPTGVAVDSSGIINLYLCCHRKIICFSTV